MTTARRCPTPSLPSRGMPDLDLIWRAYLHRFDIEHIFWFAGAT
jgi:hypothetical protein